MSSQLARSLFLGLCPRCGQGRLFRGFIALREVCLSCGCDFSRYEPDDGPAAFVTLFAGIMSAPVIFWLEVFYVPPYWVYAVFWLPVLLFVTVLLIRPVKAWLVLQNYINLNDGE